MPPTTGARRLAAAVGTRDGVVSDGDRAHVQGVGDDFVTDVINHIAREGIRVTGFRTETPTLEDVFLKLTGRRHPRLTMLKGFWKLTWVETKVFAARTDGRRRHARHSRRRVHRAGTGASRRTRARQRRRLDVPFNVADPGGADDRPQRRPVARRHHVDLSRGRHSQAPARHAALAGHDPERARRWSSSCSPAQPGAAGAGRAAVSFPGR